MKRVFILILIACVTRVFGQCPSPRLMDQNMVASQKPLYINKIVNETDPDTFLLTIYSPKDINNYSIDFGDGTTITGALWKAGIPVSHSYTIGKFTLTLLESMNGCTGKVSGMVINDRKPGATAIPPTLNISGCVPHALTFVNNTTNASPMTKFRWEWGDGTIDMQDASGIGQPISHTYLSAKGGCGKVVKITAISLSDSSFATYGPYDFWDVDVTIVKASAVNICAGQLLSFYDSTKYNCNKSNRYIQWDFSEAGGPVTSWLPNTPQNKIRKNIIDGTAGQSYTIYLSDSNSCGIKKSSVKVNIINSPTAVIRASSQTICTGQTIQFTNTSFGGANLFHWDFGDGTGWTTVKTMAPINHRYIKSGIFKVRLVSEITGAPSCSDTASLTIESISLPQVHFSMDKREGCGSLQVNLTNLTVNGVIWEWYLDNALISQANTPPALNFNMPGVHEIRLKSTNKAGCSAMSSSAVFIYPEINVDASIENSCAGTPVKLTNLSSFTSAMPKGGILREQYDSPSKPYLLNSISNIGGIADISGVLYSFETVNNPGIDYASRMRAFIYPPISGNYTFWLAADTIAELWLSTGDSTSGKRKIAFTEASTGFRTIGAYATQQSSPIYLEAGKYYYVEALTRKDRQFNDYLSVGWTIPDGRIDMPIPGQYLAPFSTGWNLSQYIWSFNNGETSLQNNPYYTFASPGLYSVTLYEGSAKCSAAKTFLAKVNPSSKTDFELSDTAGCTPFKFTLTNRSSNATKSFIYFSDSSQLSQNNQWSAFDHTFTNNSRSAKKYFIKMVTESPDGCLDSLTKYVTVYPGPDADFSYQLTNGHCSPVGLSLQNLSSGSSAYHWNFGNGDTLSSTLSFLNYKLENKTGHIIYDTITLRAYSATGCYTESREVIEVFPEPAIAIYSSDSACHLQPVQFSADPLLSDLHWTFGDSLVSQKSPSFSFKNYGNTAIDYKIQLKATSVFGCTASYTKKITVHPNPQSNIEFLTPAAGCSPLRVTMQSTLQKNLNYVWMYGKAVLDSRSYSCTQIFQNQGSNAESFDIHLLTESEHGCKSFSTAYVKVYPQPVASFSPDVHEGCSPLKVTFANNSVMASYYSWNFKDGTGLSGEINPSHEFTSPKDSTFEVMLISTSDKGCSDTVTSEINIKPSVAPVFSLSSTVVAPGDSLYLSNLSGKGNYRWNFGDGEVSEKMQPAYHIFDNFGEYNVTLISFSGNCTDSSAQKITVVNGIPQADFSGSGSGCGSVTVKFINHSKNAGYYTWDFGDGNVVTVHSKADFVHTFYNYTTALTVFNVTLTAYSPAGTDSKTLPQAIVLKPLPALSFAASADTIYTGSDITFHNTSRNSISYTWNFGDGSSLLYGKSPNHTYLQPGNYNVILIGKSIDGCIDSISIPQVVKADRSGRIIMPNAFTPNTSDPQANGLNDIFKPAYYHEVAEYQMYIFNKWGDQLFSSDDKDKGWNGYYNGKLCEQDVYVYKIKVKYTDGNSQVLVGDINLIQKF